MYQPLLKTFVCVADCGSFSQAANFPLRNERNVPSFCAAILPPNGRSFQSTESYFPCLETPFLPTISTMTPSGLT